MSGRPPHGAAPGPDERPTPARDSDVWDALGTWRGTRRPFVLATVIGSRGFTPRKAGARMLIGDDGATVGTIGGGAIEHQVLTEARALKMEGETTLLRTHLTQELGMCCGGEMRVFLERIVPAPRLYLFGAGYIAKPLAAIAAGCGFDVEVIDERTEWAVEARFPTSRLVVRAPDVYAAGIETTEADYAVIVTHDHALDQRLVQTLLPRPLRFLGMIGSIPKQRKFMLRLRAKGFNEALVAKLHTPLGADIGARTPEEIAVSVMAQLIQVRRAPADPAAQGGSAEARDAHTTPETETEVR
jgi:xanthine dehydrogenase accessory factor